MELIQWSKDKIHRLSIWDFAVTKMALVIFGMMIGAYIATFVKKLSVFYIYVLNHAYLSYLAIK